MPQTGDILQIKMFQELVGIEGEILNVYYYRCGSIAVPFNLSDAAADFVDSWEDQIVELYLNVQSNQLRHTKLEVNNLMDYEGDYFSRGYDVSRAGNVPEDYSASSTAWSIELVRTTRVTRNGSKRIAGCPDSYIVANNATGTAISALSPLLDALGTNLFIVYDAPLTVELEPVIVKSPVSTTVPPTVINKVSEAVFRGVGTQNSRKQLLP